MSNLSYGFIVTTDRGTEREIESGSPNGDYLADQFIKIQKFLSENGIKSIEKFCGTEEK